MCYCIFGSVVIRTVSHTVQSQTNSPNTMKNNTDVASGPRAHAGFKLMIFNTQLETTVKQQQFKPYLLKLTRNYSQT